MILVVAGTYEQLFTYTIFSAFIFYALTAFAVIIFRHTQPEVARRVPGLGVSICPYHFCSGIHLVSREHPY